MTNTTSSHGQRWYSPRDKDLADKRRRAKRILETISAIPQDKFKQRKSHFESLFKSTGKAFYIESPFHCDYGDNIELGDNFYINTGGVMLDAAPITIGKNCMIGPSVSFYTSTHPLDAELRAKHLEACEPITLGDDVWIGGNVTVLGGVTLGDRVVVGAGAVVTKSFHDDVVIAGNPAKIIKRLA